MEKFKITALHTCTTAAENSKNNTDGKIFFLDEIEYDKGPNLLKSVLLMVMMMIEENFQEIGMTIFLYLGGIQRYVHFFPK